MRSTDKRERLQLLQDGWMHWLSPANVVLLAEAELPPCNITVLPQLPQADAAIAAYLRRELSDTNYIAANLRHLKGLFWLRASRAELLAQYDWILLVDDDAFVNLPLLLEFLGIPPSLPLLLGHMIEHTTQNAWDERQPTNLTYPAGGAGMLFSLAAATRIASVLFSPACPLYIHLNDVTVGRCAHKVNVTKIHARQFNPHFFELRRAKDLPDGVQLSGGEAHYVQSFKCLGCVVDTSATWDKELQARISKARGKFAEMQRLWHTHRLKVSLKMQCYRAYVLPVLLFGSESWALTKAQIQQLEVVHSDCMRQILNVCLCDRHRLTDIRQRCRRRSKVNTLTDMFSSEQHSDVDLNSNVRV